MINVTNAFRTEVFENDNRNYQYSIRITFHDDSYIDIGNESLLSNGGVTIDEAVSSDDKLGVGTAIVNKLTLVLQNFDGAFDQYDFQKANVVLKVGLLVNGQLEQFQRGIYIVSEPPIYDQSRITLVCYDYMSLFDVLFSTVTIAYPTTVGGIINGICAACGVGRVSQTIPNEDLAIQSNPASNTTTCREMLSYIGQISGTNANITNIGKLQFVWYSDGFSSEPGNVGDVEWVNQENIPVIYTLDAARYDTVVTGIRIVIQGTEDTDIGAVNTYETGTDDYLVSIENNPLVNASNAEDILAVLAIQLVGFKYRKASFSHVGIPWLQAGDSAQIADANGNSLNVLVSSTVFISLDRQTTISAGSSEAVNNPSRFSFETVQRTKTLKDIKPVIQTLNQRIANSGGLFETRITDQQGATITYLHNKENLSESDIQIKVSDVGVVVTSNGTAQTPTWYGLTVDGNLIANILQTNGINADWIDTGALVIYDNDNNEIFRADKSGKIFRWNAQNSQMDADGNITLRRKYDSIEGGDADAPAFKSIKDSVYHLSQGIYAVQLTRDTIKYGNDIVMERTIYYFSTEADYESFVENGDDESYAASVYTYDMASAPYGITATDSSNNTYFDLNWLSGEGYIRIGVDSERLIEPFWADLNEITSGTNMNSYQTPGTYKCSSSSTASSVTNTPFSEPFQCCVYKNGTSPGGVTGSIMQIAWNFSSSTTIKYRMYVTNTGWSAWYGIQKEGVAFKTGTVTIASGTRSTATQTISITDIVPSGKTPYGVVLTLGGYPMPYVNSSGNVVTWISGFSNSAVTISNKTSAWSNYNYYLTIFYH